MASEQAAGATDTDTETDTEPRRRDAVVGQDDVYLAKPAAGRSGHKLHLRPDCQYLSPANVRVMRKPASVYPEGYADLCRACATDGGDDAEH